MLPSENRADLETFLAIWQLNVHYADALDGKDYTAWPALFTPDGRYTILSAENAKRGRNLAILDYTHPGMMRDRMLVLQEAAVFTQAAERRMFSNLIVIPADDGTYRASANFTIYRTDNVDGTSVLFVVGRYEDEVQIRSEGPRFRTRTVMVDTFSIPNHIGFPL